MLDLFSDKMTLYTVKKGIAVFPSPAGISLTKLSLAGNNLIIPGQEEFGNRKPFLQCIDECCPSDERALH